MYESRSRLRQADGSCAVKGSRGAALVEAKSVRADGTCAVKGSRGAALVEAKFVQAEDSGIDKAV